MSVDPPRPYPAPRERARRELAQLVVSLVVLLFASIHLAAIFTEAINWDEFGLLARSARMLRTGEITGGRPGAADLLLAPIVRGCTNAVEVARGARLLWFGFTALGVTGLYFFLRELRSGRGQPAIGAVAGVALLTMVPVWQRWSLQVRTDQVAIACGLWAGVALLRSRSRPWLAPAAGFLFGLGYLFTQKLLYVAALVLAAAFWKCVLDPEDRRGRRLRYFALALGAASAIFGIVLVSYRLGGSAVVKLPPPLTLGAQFDVFDYYRRTYGFSFYRAMAPTLLPQWAGFVLLAFFTLRSPERRPAAARLLAAWTIVALGVAVALFHAASFPYFWMTLGLFPAVALGLTFEDWSGAVPVRLRKWTGWALGLALILPGLASAFALLADSQGVQFESLAFVERSFPPTAAGFQAEGALLCRAETGPFPPMFRQDVVRRFAVSDPSAAIADTRALFAGTPVQFLIASGAIAAFPIPILDFLKENYQSYFGPVLVAGRTLRGAIGGHERVEILVPGVYRFLPREADAGARIRVAGSELRGGQTIRLEAGAAEIDYVTDLGRGLLVLALEDPPRKFGQIFFDGEAARDMRARR